ncbi:MAG: hypothetical protein MUP70_03840 [Candidatus Aminicenantes bacterium]|nr:hypothetical protein [Candidatus Aminicenantes bacterium]
MERDLPDAVGQYDQTAIARLQPQRRKSPGQPAARGVQLAKGNGVPQKPDGRLIGVQRR